jgi:hypothetical protein
VTSLNRIRWWTFEVNDATELADLLNDMQARGLEKDCALSLTNGHYVVMMKMFVTHENESVANLLDQEHAKSKEAAGVLPAERLSVSNSAPLPAPVGKRRGDMRTAKQT